MKSDLLPRQRIYELEEYFKVGCKQPNQSQRYFLGNISHSVDTRLASDSPEIEKP